MAHKFSASQDTAFPKVLRIQETMLPIIPGSTAAAFPTSFARALLKALSVFFTHSLSPLLSNGGGVGASAGAGALPPLPLSARTRCVERGFFDCSQGSMLLFSERVVAMPTASSVLLAIVERSCRVRYPTQMSLVDWRCQGGVAAWRWPHYGGIL